MKSYEKIYKQALYFTLSMVAVLFFLLPNSAFSQVIDSRPLEEQLIYANNQITHAEQEILRVNTEIQAQQAIITELDNQSWWQPQFNRRAEAEAEIRRLTEERNILIDQKFEHEDYRNRINIQINEREAAAARAAGDIARAEELERQNEQIAQNIQTNRQQRDEHLTQAQNHLESDPYSVQSQQADRNACTSWSGFNLDACVANIIDAFYTIVIWLLSWLLWLIDTLFAKIIDVSIVNFGDLLADLDVVDTGWRVVRDVANIFFIFILLYLAISTALQTPGVDTRKVLVNIIIIALVINFSAVFTRIAIDASNITALTFYNLIGIDGDKPDLSAYFRNALSWFEHQSVDQNAATTASGNTQNAGSATLAALAKNSGMMILLVITIFTLLAASVLLLIRAISLVILIIVSPLAFLGYGFKPLSEIFNKWLDRLKCDVLFAPLFFFLLYLTFGLFQNVYGTPEARATIDHNVASQVIMFLMLNGLMLGSIMIAQKVGCQMGGKAFAYVKDNSINTFGKFGISTKTPKKLAGGAAGLVGRNTIGRGARAIQQSDTFKNFASKAPKKGWVANVAAEKVAGFGFGSGLGFNQRTEQRQKRQDEQLKLIKDPTRRAQYLTNLNLDDAKKKYGDMSDREKAELRINAIDTGNTELIKSLGDLQNALKGEKKESADKEYEKQLRQYLKVATKDFTDKSGNQVKKGDQLTMDQQLEMFDKLGEVFVKDGANDEEKKKQQEKGKDLQQISYNAMSDADKVSFTKEAEKNTNTVGTKNRLDTINEFEKEYIKGKGEAEQKFYDEKEKIDKRVNEQALKEEKRKAKIRIDKVFEGQNKATYTLTTDNIQILKEGINKLSSEDISNLDIDILQNTQFQELLQKGDYSKIYANTEKIGRENLSKIKNSVLSNPKISDEVKDGIEPTYSKRKKGEAEREGRQPTQPQGPTIITPETPYKEPRSRTKYDSNGNKINDDYTEPIKDNL